MFLSGTFAKILKSCRISSRLEEQARNKGGEEQDGEDSIGCVVFGIQSQFG